jgi:hypothetical protein
MTLPTTIKAQLDVLIDEENGRVTLTHPLLGGKLEFSFATPDMAEVQLQAVRLDKNKNIIEEIVDDTTSLLLLSGQLKEAVKELRK